MAAGALRFAKGAEGPCCGVVQRRCTPWSTPVIPGHPQLDQLFYLLMMAPHLHSFLDTPVAQQGTCNKARACSTQWEVSWLIETRLINVNHSIHPAMAYHSRQAPSSGPIS
jgi:hypothetical protein